MQIIYTVDVQVEPNSSPVTCTYAKVRSLFCVLKVKVKLPLSISTFHFNSRSLCNVVALVNVSCTCNMERFSVDCHKTKTKAITTANQKKGK